MAQRIDGSTLVKPYSINPNKGFFSQSTVNYNLEEASMETRLIGDLWRIRGRETL